MNESSIWDTSYFKSIGMPFMLCLYNEKFNTNGALQVYTETH